MDSLSQVTQTSNLKFNTMLALWNIRDDKTLTKTEWALTNKLISYMDANGWCNPGIRALAERCMRLRSVSDTLKKLESSTHAIKLEVHRADPTKRDSKGHLGGNEYRLSPGALWKAYEQEAAKIPVAPVVPMAATCSPDGKQPVVPTATEEDLREDGKEEEERSASASSSFSNQREREAENGKPVQPRPWFTAEAISYATDMGFDAETIAAAFVASSKPHKIYTEKSFKGFTYKHKKKRDEETAKAADLKRAAEAEARASKQKQIYAELNPASKKFVDNLLAQTKPNRVYTLAEALTELGHESRRRKEQREREAKMTPEEIAASKARLAQLMDSIPKSA